MNHLEQFVPSNSDKLLEPRSAVEKTRSFKKRWLRTARAAAGVAIFTTSRYAVCFS